MKARMEQREVSANPRRIRPWDKQGPAQSRCVHTCFLVEAALARNSRRPLVHHPLSLVLPFYKLYTAAGMLMQLGKSYCGERGKERTSKH